MELFTSFNIFAQQIISFIYPILFFLSNTFMLFITYFLQLLHPYFFVFFAFLSFLFPFMFITTYYTSIMNFITVIVTGITLSGIILGFMLCILVIFTLKIFIPFF